MTSPLIHRGLVLDPVDRIGGYPAFVCVGVQGCGCLVLDVEQHADWHLHYAKPDQPTWLRQTPAETTQQD